MNAPEVTLTQDSTAGAAGSWERQQLGRVGLEKVGLRECWEGAMETTPTTRLWSESFAGWV